MTDETKTAVDVIAATGTGAAWLGMAPDIVAIATGVWVCIRIWETSTVKKLTGRGDV